MRVNQLEPIVLKCLVSDDRCKKDDFILYLSVIEQYGLDTTMSIHSALKNHSLLNSDCRSFPLRPLYRN